MENADLLMSKTKELKSNVTSLIKKPVLASFAILLLLLLALPATTVNAESSNQDNADNVIYITTTYGDLNNDNSVDSLDYVLMKSALISDNTDMPDRSSDLDGDHKLTSLDLSIMKQYLLQKIYVFPVEDTLKATKNGSIINVEQNKSFEICLYECASTGYQWIPKLSDNTGLSLYSVETLINLNTQIPGCSTPEIWTFKALKPGTYTLTFESRRPWQESEEGLIDTVKYTINVI